ncbi:MAG: exodeoxyribonuclease VII small subunit [Planctomycetota bacterium]
MAKSPASGKDSAAAASDAPSYRAAAAEIEQILGQIEDERSVDIDELAAKVERASTLIRLCFQKLKSAEMQVRRVTEELGRATQEASAAAPASGRLGDRADAREAATGTSAEEADDADSAAPF